MANVWFFVGIVGGLCWLGLSLAFIYLFKETTRVGWDLFAAGLAVILGTMLGGLAALVIYAFSRVW